MLIIFYKDFTFEIKCANNNKFILKNEKKGASKKY